MCSMRSLSTIAILGAALAAAAAPATAEQRLAAARGDGVTAPPGCGDKLRGNTQWASLIFDAGMGWPHYAAASQNDPAYDHGPCDLGALQQSYGYADGPVAGRDRHGNRHRRHAH